MTRVSEHWRPSNLKREASTHCAKWCASLIAKGLLPVVHVLESAPDKESLPEMEKFWIAQGKSLGWRLTNLTIGGDGRIGAEVSKETREKLSRAFKGGRLTEEHKQKISNSKRGKPCAEGTLLALQRGRTDRSLSAETRARMSASQKNNVFSAEHRLKISLSKSGCPLSPEHIEKMRAPKSEGHRLSLSRSRGGRPFVDESGRLFRTQIEASLALGIHRSSISLVLHGKQRSAMGHRFRYADSVPDGTGGVA